MERLAWLYIVRDHAIISSKDEKEQDLIAMPSVAVSSGSEFMEVCAKADAVKMWSVLDEMAETIKLLNPRLYQATIDKLKG